MQDETEKPPYGYAALTFLVIFVVYVLTLSPTTAFWDTSEYIAAAKVLGIPHPPGNPLFTVLAHVWGMLPLAANYAKRINLFAAFTSAAGAGFWFLVAERWLRNILPARGPRLGAAFAGIFASAMAWTVWNQSTVNEKVYTVSLLSIAMIVWCMVRWADLPDGPRRNGLLILSAYLAALTSTNHMMGVLALPVIAIYVLWSRPRLALQPWVMLMAWVLLLGVSGILGDSLTILTHGGNWANPASALTYHGTVDGSSGIAALTRIGGLLGIVGIAGWGIYTDRRNPLLYVGVLAVVVGLTLNYVYLPIRAAQHPPINEGEPAGFFSQALSDVLNRLQYGKPPVSQRMSPLGAQLGMYWHYWSWQWAKDIGALSGLATGLFTALCAWGLGILLKRDRRAGVTAAILLFTLTLLLIYYLNFRYMFTYPNVSPDDREVRERDYFYVASFAFVGVLLAAGFAAAVRATGEWLGDRVNEHRRWIAGTPVFALALIPLLGNRLSAPRNHETLASDFAVDMLQSVAPYGILITAGDNDTFPLWFAQEVLGVRRDVTLANLSLMNTDWHLRQLKRRVTPTFNPEGQPAIWQRNGDTSAVPLTGMPEGGWQKPSTPVFAETEAFLDSLAEVMPAPKDTIPIGSIWVKFGTQTITKSDLAVLFLIKDNLGKRPIFFSWSDGGYPDTTLGLEQYLVTQGMVRQLMPRPVTPGGPIVNSSMGLVNVPLTRTLLFDVYHPEAAAHDRPLGWFDPPSASILSLYEIVYRGSAQVLLQAGDSVHSAKASSIADRIAKSIGSE
ncbi:MAG: glycosyltransferase family 117 protein [Gemmatimonadales bacterium]